MRSMTPSVVRCLSYNDGYRFRTGVNAHFELVAGGTTGGRRRQKLVSCDKLQLLSGPANCYFRQLYLSTTCTCQYINVLIAPRDHAAVTGMFYRRHWVMQSVQQPTDHAPRRRDHTVSVLRRLHRHRHDGAPTSLVYKRPSLIPVWGLPARVTWHVRRQLCSAEVNTACRSTFCCPRPTALERALPPTLRAAGLTPELGKFKRLLKTYLFHVVETAAHSDYLTVRRV